MWGYRCVYEERKRALSASTERRKAISFPRKGAASVSVSVCALIAVKRDAGPEKSGGTWQASMEANMQVQGVVI